MSGQKRKRDVHFHILVTAEEMEAIHERMAEAGTTNAGAFGRKMLLQGYVLHVDLSPVRELVSLQRRCANNMNQIAKNSHISGGHQSEVTRLQADYEQLWGKVSDVLKKLTAIVEL